MANVTISELPSASKVEDTDVLMIEDGTTTKKITREKLLTNCSMEGHTHSYSDITGTPPSVNLDGYATEQYVNNAISNAQLSGGGGDVDLSDYALKSEIPTRTSQLVNDNSYATTSYVDSKVALGGGGGGGASAISLGMVNVKDYGAVGDGVTDDSQAIRNAIAYMCSFAKQCSSDLGWKSYMPTLYFPHGKYLVTQKGTLNCIGVALQGYNIKGAGYLSSEILYSYDSTSDPDGGYLLVNGNDNWFAFSYIEDLTIRGTNGKQNFWQIISRDGSPQANRFRRAGFYNLNRCVTVTRGTYNYNADLFRFESCKASKVHGWFFGVEADDISQTVVHTFRDCDIEDINGYGIYMRSGGAVEVRGGSWIATRTGRMFHFDDMSGVGIGLSNRNINIYGTKFEYQYYDNSDNNINYYPLFYNNSRMAIAFYGCNFCQFTYTGTAARANYGYLSSMGVVYFYNCHMPACFGIKTAPALSVAMDDNDQRAIVRFKDCVLRGKLNEIMSQENNNWYQQGAYADVSAEGCYSSEHSSVGNLHINTQLHQSFGNRAEPSKQKMIVLTRGTNPLTSLPCAGASFTYDMPQGAIITRITIYFRYAGNGTTYKIDVSNNSGKLLATASHALNAGAKGYTTEVFEVVEPAEGASSVTYSLKVTGTGENANGGLPGFVAVEYY